jgi:hypothetical protein
LQIMTLEKASRRDADKLQALLKSKKEKEAAE